MGISDCDWMHLAYSLALQAGQQDEIPVGAVVVFNNRPVGMGFNQVRTLQNPCAHAEMIAIQQAALALENYRLEHCTLYTTLEPCSMCAGAIVQARISRLVFATRDLKAGAAGSVLNLLKGYPLNHTVDIDEGLLQAPCKALLQQFFLKIRTSL